MIWFVTIACVAGALVGLGRQVNGRLSTSTSPLVASFWNHIVGFVFLTVLGFTTGGILSGSVADIPLYAYLGGPFGVVFVAASSWVVTKIGAMNSALLIIAGQMVASVALDILNSASLDLLTTAVGAALIVGGVMLKQRSEGAGIERAPNHVERTKPERGL